MVLESRLSIPRQLSERSEGVRLPGVFMSFCKELSIDRGRPRMGPSKLVGGRFRAVGNSVPAIAGADPLSRYP